MPNEQSKLRTESINLRVYPELKKRLEEEAKKDYRSVSSLVTKILEQWGENRESLHQ